MKMLNIDIYIYHKKFFLIIFPAKLAKHLVRPFFSECKMVIKKY